MATEEDVMSLRNLVLSLASLVAVVIPGVAQAIPITLTGESAALGALLVSQPAAMVGPKCIAPRTCVQEVTITVNNAPAPLSDGLLTVIAAEHIGHRHNEQTPSGLVATPFATAFNPATDPLGALCTHKVPNCA